MYNIEEKKLPSAFCSKKYPTLNKYNILLEKFTQIQIKTRLTYNCAHLRSTKESLTIEYLRWKLYWIFWVKIFRVKTFLVKFFLGENFWGQNSLGENFLCENLLGENFFGRKFFG